MMGLEIISGVERRRRWSDADKLRIVAEADEPGAKVAAVARRHEISRSILWTWRKQARVGELRACEPLGFLYPSAEHVGRFVSRLAHEKNQAAGA
jgi:transposase